jgi:hypothetical protein
VREREGVPVERPLATASARGPVWSRRLLHLLLGFFAALVGLLDDVAGDALGAEAERYSRRQRDRAEDDQKRRGCQLHRNTELRDGRESGVDDDRVAGYVGEEVAARGAAHYTGQEVGQERREDQYQDRRDDARDVGDELREDR